MTDELRLGRVIDAPPDVVFRAFTSHGGQVAFYGTDDPRWIVESQCDLRVGGLWTVTFGPSPDPDEASFDFSVEFTFEEQDGQTLMTVIQSGFPTPELRDEHRRGVPNAFARLERAVRASK